MISQTSKLRGAGEPGALQDVQFSKSRVGGDCVVQVVPIGDFLFGLPQRLIDPVEQTEVKARYPAAGESALPSAPQVEGRE